MNTKTDEGLYEKARKLFISKASIDEFAGWATPRQVSTTGSCAAPGSPSSRVSTATTSRTSGSPTATCSMSS